MARLQRLVATAGVLVTEKLSPHGQRLAVELFRLGGLTLAAEHGGEVVEATNHHVKSTALTCHVGVLVAEKLTPHVQRLAEELFRLGVFTLVL